MAENTAPKRKKGLLSLQGSLIVLLLLIIIFIEIIYFIPEKEEARPQGYEIAALTNLRHISKAQTQFKSESTAYGDLASLQKAGLIDELLGGATEPRKAKSGFIFKVTASADTWSCVAIPAIPGITGKKSFYTDQTGAFRLTSFMKKGDTEANANSPTLEEWCCRTTDTE